MDNQDFNIKTHGVQCLDKQGARVFWKLEFIDYDSALRMAKEAQPGRYVSIEVPKETPASMADTIAGIILEYLRAGKIVLVSDGGAL